MYPKPVAGCVGSMPIVTSSRRGHLDGQRAHAVAERVGVGDDVVGGEGAHDRVRVAPLEQRAAARPIAAIESRGDGSASTRARVELGQLGDHRVSMRPRRSPRGSGRPPAARAGRRSPGSSCGRRPSGRAGTWASPSATAATAGSPHHRRAPLPRTSRSWAPRLYAVRWASLGAPYAGPVPPDRRSLRRDARSRAAGRCRPTAGDVLRLRHRRARRAVGGDVRQLGRQDRLPARRGVPTSSAGSACWSTSRRTG